MVLSKVVSSFFFFPIGNVISWAGGRCGALRLNRCDLVLLGRSLVPCTKAPWLFYHRNAEFELLIVIVMTVLYVLAIRLYELI